MRRDGDESVAEEGLSDQTVKLRIVLATAVPALAGFLLEVGPVGGAFQLAITALALQLPALGFLAYLALAASAAVGLRVAETERVAKERDAEEVAAGEATGDGELEAVRARVRPELPQFRMFITALGGYVALKSMSLALMWPALPQSPVTREMLMQGFQFGFLYVALGWFVLWQFLRWYAEQRRWTRLQDELIGADVTRIIAVVILIKPLVYFLSLVMGAQDAVPLPLLTLSMLLHLAVVLGAGILWMARRETLRQTVIGLFAVSGIILLLTLALAAAEARLVG